MIQFLIYLILRKVIINQVLYLFPDELRPLVEAIQDCSVDTVTLEDILDAVSPPAKSFKVLDNLVSI